MTASRLPGTRRHQAMLAVVSAFDARVHGVCVFGSLGRDTWDQDSDLDLDVVLAPGVTVNAVDEVQALCDSFSALDESVLLLVPDGVDVADVVLRSFMQLSIRYHSLEATSQNIVDSLVLLTGDTDLETIRAAGEANRTPAEPLEQALDRIVRWLIDADIALRRRKFWQTLQLIERVRQELMTLFARTHGGTRPFHSFDAHADPHLRESFGRTLPQYNLDSARQALGQLLDIVEHDLGSLTDGALGVSEPQREAIARLRLRQTTAREGVQ